MSSSLRDLILANVPKDGSTIGNQALLGVLRNQLTDLDEGDYLAAKEGLSLPQVEGILNGQSGLLGVSGLTADMRSVSRHAGDLECTHCHADAGHGPRAGLGGPMTEAERRGAAAPSEKNHGD